MTIQKLKIRKIGNSLGVIFSKETVTDMNVAEGDELSLVKTENGHLLTAYDPKFEKVMEAVNEGRRRYRNALRELAK